MNLITIWNKAAGYRTYLATAAAVLAQLATLTGMCPTCFGQSLTVIFAGLAAVALRLSTKDQNMTIGEAIATIQELRALMLMQPTPASRPIPEPPIVEEPDYPATIPFPGSPFPGGRTLPMILLAAALVIAGAAGSTAQDRPTLLTSMKLSEPTRAWYRNPDGSCVQCSIGMAGVHCNDLNAASLLWDTSYGPAVRGGSWPSRVERYCDERGIKAWSVTGATVDDTMPWMVWAARTGRFAAIGAGTAHYQTLYGYDPHHEKPWMVCNNNSTSRIDRYGDREFRQLHAASGPWVVVLQLPSSDPPTPVKWWK